jgi:FkbM family methyltransferase
MLTAQAEQTPDFFFVQIGSCDGVNKDPIHKYVIKYHWSGILVEPVKFVFEKLVDNYKGENKLVFENAAISDKNGTRDFYRLQQSKDVLPIWYDQLGSFFTSTILKHKRSIPDIEKRMMVEKVPVITMETLIKKHSIRKIDLLHVDAEGYDYEILKQIDFAQMKPKMILYENKHLTRNDFKASEKLLRKNGYAIKRILQNTYAFI